MRIWGRRSCTFRWRCRRDRMPRNTSGSLQNAMNWSAPSMPNTARCALDRCRCISCFSRLDLRSSWRCTALLPFATWLGVHEAHDTMDWVYFYTANWVIQQNTHPDVFIQWFIEIISSECFYRKWFLKDVHHWLTLYNVMLRKTSGCFSWEICRALQSWDRLFWICCINIRVFLVDLHYRNSTD